MKEKKNITIVDKKQIPTEEPARQYYFMEIAKQYVAELAEQKGAPLTFCVTTFGCQMNAREFREAGRNLREDRICGSTG